MGIFSRNKSKSSENVEERYNIGGLAFMGGSFATTQSMRLSAVYCAVNQISNSVASIPFDVIKWEGGEKKLVNHKLKYIINHKPEQRMNRYNWMKIMVESIMLKGSAFALIHRDERLNVTALEYIDADYVTTQVNKYGNLYYLVEGMKDAVSPDDMIHLYMHIDQNFNGISVIKYACNTIKATGDAEKHSDNFYRSGANLSGIIKAPQNLTNEQKKQIKESWVSTFGSENNGATASVAVLPLGLEYQSISVNPEDAQLLDTRKYNVIEIARFFNISPSKLWVMEGESYNSREYVQLTYMEDTIKPYISIIVDEFNRKLFKPSEVGVYEIMPDWSETMITNKESEAKYYRELLVNGILSINEVRKKLGYNQIEEGEEHYMQINMGTLKNINSGEYVKSNEGIDNKVKSNNNNNNNKED